MKTSCKEPKSIVKVKITKKEEKKIIKDLIEENKKLCSLICKTMANGLCEVCGRIGTAPHHAFGVKAFPHLRFTVINLIWSCYYCHIRKVHQQGQYELVRDTLLNRLTLKGYEKLKNIAYQNPEGKNKKLYTIETLTDIRIELKKELDNIL
jgi:hypothetical protein